MYKAKIDIGDFKAGDVVPDDLAIVWEGMYKESPVEKVDGEEPKVEEPKVQEPKSEEPKAEEPKKEEPKDSVKESEDSSKEIPNWIDDYLSRNSFVVANSLNRDKHERKSLKAMLEYERANKNRNKIVELLNKKLEGEQ